MLINANRRLHDWIMNAISEDCGCSKRKELANKRIQAKKKNKDERTR